MTKSLVCCFDVLSTFATFTVRVLHAVRILFIPGTRARVRMSPNVDIVDYLPVCWTFCHAFPSTAASIVLFVYSCVLYHSLSLCPSFPWPQGLKVYGQSFQVSWSLNMGLYRSVLLHCFNIVD